MKFKSINLGEILIFLNFFIVGVSVDQPDHLKFLYECSEDFSVLPTYGVIPCLNALMDSGLIMSALKERGIQSDPTKVKSKGFYTCTYSCFYFEL